MHRVQPAAPSLAVVNAASHSLMPPAPPGRAAMMLPAVTDSSKLRKAMASVTTEKTLSMMFQQQQQRPEGRGPAGMRVCQNWKKACGVKKSS